MPKPDRREPPPDQCGRSFFGSRSRSSFPPAADEQQLPVAGRIELRRDDGQPEEAEARRDGCAADSGRYVAVATEAGKRLECGFLKRSIF